MGSLEIIYLSAAVSAIVCTLILFMLWLESQYSVFSKPAKWLWYLPSNTVESTKEAKRKREEEKLARKIAEAKALLGLTPPEENKTEDHTPYQPALNTETNETEESKIHPAKLGKKDRHRNRDKQSA